MSTRALGLPAGLGLLAMSEGRPLTPSYADPQERVCVIGGRFWP
jgi:hypothetical protein